MKKILVVFLCVLFFCTTSYASEKSKLDKFIEDDYSRLSIEINKKTFNKNVNLVIVNEKKESDIISALSFANMKKLPVMLIKNDEKCSQEDSPILKEIDRLAVKNVYIIGGEKSVSEDISDTLKLKGIIVTRIGGKNRVEVSNKVIEENSNVNPPDTLVICDMKNFNGIQAQMAYYLKNGYLISFVDGEKYDDSVRKLLIDKGISNVIIVQPSSVLSKEYDVKLKESGLKVTRENYNSIYEANYSKNSNIKYSKIIFTEYKDRRASLLASYAGLQKNYINVLVNEGNADLTTKEILSRRTTDGVYIGNNELFFKKLAQKLELFYEID